MEKLDEETIEAAIARATARGRELATQPAELRLLVRCIDLTTLAGDDTRARVEALALRAAQPSPNDAKLSTAAVCVYPARVADVVRALNGISSSHKVRVAAADLPIFELQLLQYSIMQSFSGGFPSGQYHLESRLLETELSMRDGANELDMVINRAAALEGDWKTVQREVAEFKRVAGDRVHLKVILCVGELRDDQMIYDAAINAIKGGADFIKTSTGKETINATLRSALIMCTAIRDMADGAKIGFKPAGGIKTAAEALAYRALVEDVLGADWVTPDLFRVGASSLLDVVLEQLNALEHLAV